MRKLYIILSVLCGLGLSSMTSAQSPDPETDLAKPIIISPGFFPITNAYPGEVGEGGAWLWWLFDGPSPFDPPTEDDPFDPAEGVFGNPPATTPVSTTPTAPDPSAARYRVKLTMFPFPKLSIDGSTVVKSIGKRRIRIKLPSGKFVTEEITIMLTEDNKKYGVGAGLHNFGPMHESRNQPFPDQIQYSFDEDPIPRPAPTPGSQMSETDQQNMEQGPSSGENFDHHFQCNHISTPHPGDEICILSLRQD